MSIYAPDPRPSRLKGAILAVLFLTVIAVGILGTALVLGTEPRLVLERTGSGAFRVTGSNYFLSFPKLAKRFGNAPLGRNSVSMAGT